MYKEKKLLLNEERIKPKSNKKNFINIKLKNKQKNNFTKKKNINSSKVSKNIKKSSFLTKKYIIIIIILLSFISILIYKFFYSKFLSLKKQTIPIAFSLNDKYLYPLIVSLTSVLYNASPKTFYVFYILLGPGISEKNEQKILGLKEKYPNCKINLIHMGEKFSKFNKNYYKSVAVYYRLELSNLITNEDKIIYLDVDTVTHKDLTEFYNIDMGKNYYMGFPGHDLTFREFNGTRNFINTGTMLVNLKKLREVNAPALLIDYYNKYGTKKVDEYLINAVFYDKIQFLPFIYGIPDFGAGERVTRSASHFAKLFQNYTNFTVEEMEYAHENRVVTHGCYDMTKWWQRKYRSLTNVGRQWFFYASKSNIFDDFCKEYHQFEKHCEQIKNEMQNNITNLKI